MNFDELEESLPNGLHDATITRLEVDWASRRAILDLQIQIDPDGEAERLGRIAVAGLVFCSVEPPEVDPARGYEATPPGGLCISTGTGRGNSASDSLIPKIPPGAFLQWFFVQKWNRLIYVCGQDLEFS